MELAGFPQSRLKAQTSSTSPACGDTNQAGDPGGKPPCLPRSLGVGEEVFSDVAIAKAHDGMFSTQYGGE